MDNKKTLVLAALSFILLALVGSNYLTMNSIAGQVKAQALELKTINKFLEENPLSAGTAQASASQAQAAQPSDAELAKLVEQIIPRGTPDIYGAELKVSFDQPVEGMNALATLDGDLNPSGKLHFADLGPNEQARYLKVGSMIACEYCCGAKTLVAPNGKPACGCAHSAAMRGLAMYLLKNHASEYTDEQILDQLSKWKTMFFPKQTIQKAVNLQAEGKGVSANSLNQLPDMVGGC